MEQEIIQRIGQRLASCRKKSGYTQDQLANMTDLSVKMISAAENGHKAMRPENIVKICNALSISTDFLLKGASADLSTIVSQKNIDKLSERQREALAGIIDSFLSAFD